MEILGHYRQAEAMQHRLDIQFTQSRGVVIDRQRIEPGRRLDAAHPVGAVNVRDVIEILARERTEQIVMQGNLGHLL